MRNVSECSVLALYLEIFSENEMNVNNEVKYAKLTARKKTWLEELITIR